MKGGEFKFFFLLRFSLNKSERDFWDAHHASFEATNYLNWVFDEVNLLEKLCLNLIKNKKCAASSFWWFNQYSYIKFWYCGVFEGKKVHFRLFWSRKYIFKHFFFIPSTKAEKWKISFRKTQSKKLILPKKILHNIKTTFQTKFNCNKIK